MKSKLAVHMIALCLLLQGISRGQAPSMRVGEDPIEASSISTNGFARSATQNEPTKRRESSITGRLVNESGQPIPNAAVNVRKVGAQANVSRSIGTDSDGRFRADDLASGAYSVSAYVPAYVPATDSVDRQYYRPGETVTLRMIKGGAIAGTVTSMEGEPLVAARVSAIRVRDGEGRAIRGAGASGTTSSRQTDDRGMYRLYGLQSGSYLIQVGGGGGFYYPSSSALDGDAPTYHPSTTRDAAAEVTVRTGDEINGIDVRYRGDRGHIVSGTLSGSLGSGPGSLGVSVLLARAPSGTIEANTYISLRGNERGFALYGVPDGEYDLVAQMSVGTDSSAASAPRRVTVKGTDVTGLDLGLAPLGAIAGRIVSEALPESERKGDCKDKRGISLDDTVIVARRDEKAGAKEPFAAGILAPTDGTPDGKGEFKIPSLIAGRYRFETRLPTEDWFVRSITVPGPATSKQNDVMNAGLALSSGQRATDVTVTIAEGAAGLRGRVAAASEGASLPSRLRLHLIPAEADSADAVVRYAEVAVENGAFSISILAPGRYFLLAREVSDEEFMQRDVRPSAWDATSRTRLRREAEAANITVELQRCQRVNEYVLKYSPASGAKKGSARTKP